MRTIEVDDATAVALERRASARGVTVSDIVAELVPFTAPSDQVAELDRRWALIQDGEATVGNDKVSSWLRTWGTSAFKPWHG